MMIQVSTVGKDGKISSWCIDGNDMDRDCAASAIAKAREAVTEEFKAENKYAPVRVLAAIQGGKQ